MKLGHHLDPRFVVAGIRPGAVREVLEQLVRPLREAGEVEEAEELLEALEQRESLQSTGVGSGIAVPHSICEELSDPRVVLGLCPEGAEYHALDDQPVHLFFLLLSPPDRTRTHIELLARVARLVRSPELLEELRSCEKPRELVEAIHGYEKEHL